MHRDRTDVLGYAFVQHALIAAVLVGIAAPTVGIFLVQRRLSLIGDGLGHVSLTGVAVGVLTSSEPVFTALLAAVAGALTIELIRARGRTSGDVALAILFYGGIAAGVVVISQAPTGTSANLTAYLFGTITTTSRGDVVAFAVLAVVVLAVTIGLRRYLFAVSDDEEYAAAAGLPVLPLNLLLSVVTAVTVVISMRVVGLLLISALMIIPVASALIVARSFVGTMALAVAIGLLVSIGGVVTSFYADTPSGGTIVLFAIGIFVALTAWRGIAGRVRPASALGRADSA
jgi:zinc transport system permease protein